MGLRHRLVFAVIGKQAKYQAVVETHAAQYHVRICQLENLAGRQNRQYIGGILVDPQPENCHILIGTYHLLRQHQVGQVEFFDFRRQFASVHGFPGYRSEGSIVSIQTAPGNRSPSDLHVGNGQVST